MDEKILKFNIEVLNGVLKKHIKFYGQFLNKENTKFVDLPD